MADISQIKDSKTNTLYNIKDVQAREALQTKQDTLVFDNSPTSGSNNPVKSSGVYSALATKADQETTYTKTEVNNLIVPANTEIVVVTSLPASGSANTIYRMQGTDSYTDYGWDGTQFVALATYNGTNLYDSTGSNTDGAMTQKAVTDELAELSGEVKIKRPIGSTYNLIDIYDLEGISGVAINNDEAVFTLASVSGTTLGVVCEENEVYTLYAEAYGEGNQSTSGNGLVLAIYYTDGTSNSIAFLNSASQFTAKSLISTYGKTISYIKFSFGTNGGNIFHVRHLMLTKGADIQTYTPKFCSADYVARKDLSELDNVAVKKEDVSVAQVSNNLANPALIKNNYYIVSDGTVLPATGWSIIGIPVKQGEKYTFGGFYLGGLGHYSFYNKEFDKGGTVVDHHGFNDPNGVNAVTTMASPQDGFLYILIQTSFSPEEAYPNLQINKGENLLAYDEYEIAITKLLGLDFDVEDKGLRELYEAEVHRNASPIKDLPITGYIKYADGVLYSGGYVTSDYIKVNKGDEFKVTDIFASATVAILAAYEESNGEKVYVQSKSLIGRNGYASFDYIVPNGVSYVRLCCNNGYKANFNYRILPYIPYVSDERVAESSNDPDYKIPTLGLIRDLANPRYVTRLYPQTKLPCVSFQFDDIPDKDSQIVDLFETYGLTCAFAFIGSTANINTKAETYANYQKKGFAIMNHSVNGTIFNTTNYTYATAQEAIMTSLNRIQNAGMVCNGFVSPSSSMASDFMPILKASHCYAFTSSTTSATANSRNHDTCDLHRYSLQSNTLETIKQYIDSSITNDQIMTFYGHAADLVDDGDTTVFSLAKIAAVIEYCIAKRDLNLLYIGNTDDCVKYFFDL